MRDPDDETHRRFMEALIGTVCLTGALALLTWWLT